MKTHFSYNYPLVLLSALLINSCVGWSQTPPPGWQSRSTAISDLIKFQVKDREYDSIGVYQRNGLYYGVRQDHGHFLYSPTEAAEQLLDSTVHIHTPTHIYDRNFVAGVPDGRWTYFRIADSTIYLVETYHAGKLVKKSLYDKRSVSIPYLIETYRDGQLLKREEANTHPKK